DLPVLLGGELHVAAPHAHVDAGVSGVLQAELESRVTLGLTDATPVVVVGQGGGGADLSRAGQAGGGKQCPSNRNTCIHWIPILVLGYGKTGRLLRVPDALARRKPSSKKPARKRFSCCLAGIVEIICCRQ